MSWIASSKFVFRTIKETDCINDISLKKYLIKSRKLNVFRLLEAELLDATNP